MSTDITDITDDIEARLPAVGRVGSGRDDFHVVPIIALLPTLLALALGPTLPGWVWMWAIAVALFLGAKGLTIIRSLLAAPQINPARLMAYCVLWPGMDVRAFCTEAKVRPPSLGEWSAAFVKTGLGVILTGLSLHLIERFSTHLIGWLGMIGLVLLLHFGLFHLASLFWRTMGLNAKAIMQSPASATSLRKFWAGKWNAGFSDLVHKYLLPGLARHLGPQSGLFVIFLISGLVHELVISLPAGGGYGGPTFYFTIQGLAVLLERSRLGQKLGLGRGLKGWCYVALMTITPVGLLFHPPFIHNVILPMLRALSSIL